MTAHAAEAAHPPAQAAIELREWAVSTALPLWAGRGFDHARGGFHELLRLDGTPDDRSEKRIRVQARQIYVFSHAAALGWYRDGLARALDACDFLVSNALSPDREPGFVHRLHPDGSVSDTRRDAYDHAFVLLALAWLARASGDAQVRALVDRTLDFVDEGLAQADGSLLESIPAESPRRQNPHMHAFEAMLALHDAIGHPQGLARAQVFLDLMRARFFDRSAGAICEYFTDEWQRVPGQAGEIVEPGHQVEWAWLLRRHERLSGRAPDRLASDLLAVALRTADPSSGLLIDEADRSHRPVRTTRRTWPQTELAKAWMAEAEIGRAGAAERAGVALTALKSHYLDRPFAGGWIDQFDQAGRGLVDQVPASTFYHVFCAIAEADRVLNDASARS